MTSPVGVNNPVQVPGVPQVGEHSEHSLPLFTRMESNPEELAPPRPIAAAPADPRSAAAGRADRASTHRGVVVMIQRHLHRWRARRAFLQGVADVQLVEGYAPLRRDAFHAAYAAGVRYARTSRAAS